MNRLPALHPAVADTRVAVRRALAELVRRREADGRPQEGLQTQSQVPPAPLALVALSGGADSLALAAAAAFEAPRAGARVGAVVVDHGLQDGSAAVAERAAEQARALGLDPVLVRRVAVARSAVGPEAAARDARYAALEEARAVTSAAALLTAHTRDDQAEQVLLALARGSGTRAIAGIPPERGAIRRPFLGIDRQTTRAACDAQELEFWVDPHNADPAYARVRVRDRALPVLEAELGPGVAANLARSAELAREDADALDALALAALPGVLDRSGGGAYPGDGAPPEVVQAAGSSQPIPDEVTLSVPGLAALPASIRQRVIRLAARTGYGSQLSREHTLTISALVTDWRGQGPIHVPGIAVSRSGERLLLRAHRSARH